MKRHYFEYGGGLGDVFRQMYEGRSYNVLADMPPLDQAEVVLSCHNPHASELFAHHPRRKQIALREIPYTLPAEADAVRAQFGLCGANDCPPNPRQRPPTPLVFFPPKQERALIEMLAQVQPFIVLSASAGEPCRSIPASILRTITEILAAHRVRLVAVGRNYPRWDRFEQPIPTSPNVINMIDKLSVPGVAQLVQRCAGTINCHSAISMLGWLENKPQLLLLDDSAWARHFKKKDAWAFGADFKTTTWLRFAQFRRHHLERFLELARGKDDHFALATAGKDSLQNDRRQE